MECSWSLCLTRKKCKHSQLYTATVYWYNLANMQNAITLFFSQILEFCMWFDNQEELMKESKV